MSIHGSTPNIRHREEREFLQIFFSLLDQTPEHRGIYRRWEREAQRAEQSGESWDMWNVWRSNTGYVRTLQSVQKYFSRDEFGRDRIQQLAGLAAKVVQRRQAEYRKAVADRKADDDHLKVLEEWKRVKRTLENKTFVLAERNAGETSPIAILILVLLAIVFWIILAGKK